MVKLKKTGGQLVARSRFWLPLYFVERAGGEVPLTVAALCPNRIARDFSSTTGWLLIALPFS